MEKYVEEKFKNHETVLKEHGETLKTHGEDIETLKVSTAVHNTQIETLCDKINDLVVTIKWLIGLSITTLVGFFIYTVQSQIFK